VRGSKGRVTKIKNESSLTICFTLSTIVTQETAYVNALSHILQLESFKSPSVMLSCYKIAIADE